MFGTILINEMYNKRQFKILIHRETILAPHVSNV